MTFTERIAGSLGALLERRTSRRGGLARAALAGSAFAVAPVRYLVRPGTAWGAIAPHNCSPGSLGCNGTELINDHTCIHEAGCLEGLAVQLPGGSGA